MSVIVTDVYLTVPVEAIFVGREVLLQDLLTSIHAAVAGRAPLQLVLTGAAGVGKTAVAKQLCRRLLQEVRGSCVPYLCECIRPILRCMCAVY